MTLPRSSESTRLDRVEFGWRVVIVIVLLALAVLTWLAAQVFLMAFAALLLAVLLDFLTERLQLATGMRHGWAFASVVGTIAIVLATLGWFAVPRVANQVSQFVHYIPEAFDQVNLYLKQREWGNTLLDYAPGMLASANIAGTLTAAAKGFLRGAVGFGVLAVVGIYVGANPGVYRAGLVKLFPLEQRRRAAEVLSEVAYTLRWWMLGQLVPVTILAIAGGIGLWLLGVPLALTLGIFTGLMVFIPYIGSVIAYLTTLPVAMLRGSKEVLYVSLLFIAIHLVEGYLITPMVQKRAVYLPPGLTIMSQILLGMTLGFFGLALATPLTAASLVIVKTLYLGEPPKHH